MVLGRDGGGEGSEDGNERGLHLERFEEKSFREGFLECSIDSDCEDKITDEIDGFELVVVKTPKGRALAGLYACSHSAHSSATRRRMSPFVRGFSDYCYSLLGNGSGGQPLSFLANTKPHTTATPASFANFGRFGSPGFEGEPIKVSGALPEVSKGATV